MTDLRDLCARMADELDRYRQLLMDDRSEVHALAAEARAALAEPEPEYPSDKELLELMPETMRDEFSYAARVSSDVTGVKPGIFRVALNTTALQYARAVLARWGNRQEMLDSSPADGEVEELVAWLLDEAIQAADASQPTAAGMLTWAAQLIGEHAELLQRQAPVPVSERLPGPEDCDDSNRVWCWSWAIGTWRLSCIKQSIHSHWLPAHALPLPQ